MEFDAVLLAPRRAKMIAQKLWHDRTINDYLDACLRECPEKIGLTALRVETGAVKRFTYREMDALANRIAAGLIKLGVGKNDVVACQLPNWWQFTLTYLACCRIGAVMNPLMHIFRERELTFMLNHGEAKVFIAPKSFRGFDYEAMARGLKPQIPSLKQLVIVDGDGPDSFEALLCGPAEAEAPGGTSLLGRIFGKRHSGAAASSLGADDITQLIYTSGTTGEPKGVMHSSNTLIANIIPYAERLHLSERDTVLMASPMSHQTGFMYGLVMPIVLKCRAILQDVWEPKKAVDLINAEGVTFTMASTPFLTDLTQTVDMAKTPVPTLHTYLCAGAPIPGPLVERARAVLGTKIVSAWGMSENGAVTLIKPEDDDERAFTTDGLPLRGVEVKTVDAYGKPCPPDAPGQLLVRSCSNFGGYLKRPQWNATDTDDWFDTGDLAKIGKDGYIRITGRSKDVIIRGGENIPVVEIESLLYRHPAIQLVAIVAYPDERLGERACAAVVPKPDQTIDLPGIIEFLKSHHVALQYMPERLEIMTSFPATPSGKIQKFRLREMLAASIKNAGTGA
jgi:cyclohexanecarboxylate-CoA ligase